MIVQSLSRFLLRFHKANPVDREYKGWDSVKRVFATGIIDDVWTVEAWRNWKDYLEKDGKKVQVLIFDSSKKDPFTYEGGLSFFGKKAVNFLEQPKSQVLKSHKDEVFDVSFCLNELPSLTMQYICAQTRTRFKVGCYDDPFSQYDLMLLRPKEMKTADFTKEMLRYLKQINAN
jgi:hypothetical protein